MLDLVDKFGAPIYVYDCAKIAQQYDRFVAAFDVPSLHVNFACKALTNISILRFLRSLGAGIDAVSIGEIEHALRAGYETSQIVFTPSSVSLKELDQAAALGVRITLDNMEAIRHWGRKHPGYPVALRINPHIMAGGNRKISVGHIDSKFGISIHHLEEVIQVSKDAGVRICGLHMHTGSDILDVQVFLQATEILFAAAEQFELLDYIDFGSGFKVAYKEGDIETDIELFGREVSARFRTFADRHNPALQLMFEPGKFLVSEAGLFLAKANVVKKSPTTTFVGLNTGFNHLIRPMFYDAYHEIINASNPSGDKGIYSVVGYICETDTFAWNRRIAEVHPGDVLAFKNAGAYAYMMASNYNSRLLPAEVLIHDQHPHLIRKRQEMKDLFRHQTDPPLPF